MKKLITRIAVALVAVVVLAVLAARLFLGAAVKGGMETLGPKLTKAPVNVKSVSLSPLSGSGSIKGLVLGNPEGFKTPSAISVGAAHLSLKPTSLLSDKIVIHAIKLQGPEITYETDLKRNNLSTIKANLQAALGGGQQAPSSPKEAKPAKKLQVNEFSITEGKIHVRANTPLGGGEAAVPLPDIHLRDLGTGPDGITPAELVEKVIAAIEKSTVEAASGAVADIGKGAFSVVKDSGNVASNALQKVTKGVGGLFKKK